MSRIKECFESRWGENGYIGEFDFSQLEVVIKAFVTGCPVLTADILSGVDMHCMSASFLFNEEYDHIKQCVDEGNKEYKQKRQDAKGPSFQAAYGAGAKSMSIKLGLSEKACKQFLENYSKRYTGVVSFDKKMEKEIIRTRKPSGRISPGGFLQGEGKFVSQTGRIYSFLEEDAPEFMQKKGKMVSFSPTQRKNYAVQGMAGDVVTLILGKLYKKIKASPLANKALLINTIHDSILLDIHKDVVHETVELVLGVMQDAPALLKEHYGITFGLPLGASAEIGRCSAEKEDYDINTQYN